MWVVRKKPQTRSKIENILENKIACKLYFEFEYLKFNMPTYTYIYIDT